MRLAGAVALLALGGLAHWQVLAEARVAGRVPVARLAEFPRQLGDWLAIDEAPVDGEIVRALAADEVVSRRYLHGPSGTVAEIFLGYFASQTPVLLADRAPHVPTVCLPNAGWDVVEERPVGAGASLLRIASGRERRDVMFWHQTAGHVFANPLWSRWYGPLERWRLGRNDLMMVRVMLPAGSGDGLDLQRQVERSVGAWFSSGGFKR